MYTFAWVLGFTGGASGKESTCQCSRHKRCGFHPWVGKIPWRRKWQLTPVFLPGESHGQRSLVGNSPWGLMESDTAEVTEHTFTWVLIPSHWGWVPKEGNWAPERDNNFVMLELWTLSNFSWEGWRKVLISSIYPLRKNENVCEITCRYWQCKWMTVMGWFYDMVAFELDKLALNCPKYVFMH